MVKFDPHKHQKYYDNWKKAGFKITGVSNTNRLLILKFLEDMELGTNINPSSRKGSRSPGRLRNLKYKMETILSFMEKDLKFDDARTLENREVDVLKYFKKMREGKINCRNNKDKPIKAVGVYVMAFKTFWHWHQRAEKKKGREINDITSELDSRDEKPKFNYFTLEDVNKLCNEAKQYYKVLMMFLIDSGIRSPTELMNVRPLDLEWNEKQNHYVLNIRQETSKTFGRRIKLLLCSQILKSYLETQDIKPESYIFTTTPQRMNQYIRRLGFRILKIGTSKGMDKYNQEVIVDGLSLYDFRHSSACYWLPRYKSESSLKYRFGWKKSDMIYYYTELLGMKDTIQDEDLYVDVSKTELENQIYDKGKKIELLEDQLKDHETKMEEVMKILKALQLEKQFEQKNSNTKSDITI